MRPRRLADAVVRPLKFTVRPHGMRASLLLLSVFCAAAECPSLAEQPPTVDNRVTVVTKLTSEDAIRVAVAEAQRRELDLRDVEARYTALNVSEDTTWFVYFQNKISHECSFVIWIDDRTGKAEPGTHTCAS